MARPQVNILLSQDERELLEAVAFVDETTASELLRPSSLPTSRSSATSPRWRQHWPHCKAGGPERRAGCRTCENASRAIEWSSSLRDRQKSETHPNSGSDFPMLSGPRLAERRLGRQ